MNKIIIVAIAALVTACNFAHHSSQSENTPLRKVEFEGHEYIIYQDKDSGGISHSESCL